MNKKMNQNDMEKIRIMEQRKKYMNSPMIFKRYKMRKLQHVCHHTLAAFATILAEHSGIDINRETKRRIETLYYWFEDNLDKLEGLIKISEIEDDKHQIISLNDFHI